jgi:hypothetical protein
LGGTRRLSVIAIRKDGMKAVELLHWEPTHLTLRARFRDPDGKTREGVLLMESGQLVEGPLLDQDAPAPPVLWRRVREPTEIAPTEA